jgi:hypothetical protein
MTRIYQPTVSENYEWALPVFDNANITILETFGRPLSHDWLPIPFKLLTKDEHGNARREADMPWIGAHAIALKPRAVSVLGEFCCRTGELLPLLCKEAELVAWNVTETIDALDEGRSELTRFSSGRIMLVDRFEFRAELVQNATAFRIPQLRTSIFVGSEFVERAEEAGLTGTRFEEVWSG